MERLINNNNSYNTNLNLFEPFLKKNYFTNDKTKEFLYNYEKFLDQLNFLSFSNEDQNINEVILLEIESLLYQMKNDVILSENPSNNISDRETEENNNKIYIEKELIINELLNAIKDIRNDLKYSFEEKEIKERFARLILTKLSKNPIKKEEENLEIKLDDLTLKLNENEAKFSNFKKIEIGNIFLIDNLVDFNEEKGGLSLRSSETTIPDPKDEIKKEIVLNQKSNYYLKILYMKK